MSKKHKNRYYHFLPRHLLVWGVIYLVALYLILEGMYYYQVYSTEKFFLQNANSYYMALGDLLAEKTPMEQPADVAHILNVYGSAMSLTTESYTERAGYTCLQDRETGEILMDTDAKLAFLRATDWDRADYAIPMYRRYQRKVAYYSCPREYIQQVVDQCDAWEKLLNEEMKGRAGRSSRGCDVLDFYIKGDTFLPGRIKVWYQAEYREENGDTAAISDEKIFDCTPGDTKGYEHFVVEENTEPYQGRKFSLGWSGYIYDIEGRLGQEESLREEALKYVEGLSDSVPTQVISSANPFLAFLRGDVTCVQKSDIRDIQGKEYRLLVYWKLQYSPLKDFDSIYVSIYLLALFILLASFTAWLDFLKNRYKLMTQEYRCTIIDSMAHDLKSPLMVAGSCAENLKENVHLEKREYYADEILQCIGRMDEIIKKNLELLNYDRVRKSLHKTRVDVRAMCQGLIKHYEPMLRERGLEVSIQGEMNVKADVYLLERALDNLISNTVNHSMEKTKIGISLGKREIRVENVAELDFKGSLKKLWEPLVMGDKSRNGKGTGLGLAIAANIFDRHKWNYKLIYKKEEKLFICRVTIPFGLLF